MLAVTTEVLENNIAGCFVDRDEEVFGEVRGRELLACADTLHVSEHLAQGHWLLLEEKYILAHHCCSYNMFFFYLEFLNSMHCRQKQS